MRAGAGPVEGVPQGRPLSRDAEKLRHNYLKNMSLHPRTAGTLRESSDRASPRRDTGLAADRCRPVDPIHSHTNQYEVCGREAGGALGEIQTMVSVQILCDECNAQFDVFELLDRSGCRCDE